MRHSAPLLIFAALTFGALAQSDEEDVEPQYVYHVEVIAFRQLDETMDPTQDAHTVTEDALDLWSQDEVEARAPRDDASDETEPQFAPLDPGQFTMSDIADKIVKGSEHEVLLHRAWQQPQVDFGEARPVRLHNERTIANDLVVTAFGDEMSANVAEPADPLMELDGFVSFTIGRFNHLIVNLELRKMVQRRAAPQVLDSSEDTRIDVQNGPFNEIDDQPVRSMDNLDGDRFDWESDPARNETVLLPAAWRITDRRRTRFDEYQYFDNEHFGVIARASRIELNVPATPQETTQP